jgi:hypothetical protein
MSPLQTTITHSGKTMSAIARDIGVPLQDLSHYVKSQREKVGSAKRRKIRAWMIKQGYIKPRRKPEYWICPTCQAKHVRGKNAAQRLEAMSFEVHGRP